MPRRSGQEVSRHDIAFVLKAPRLMSMWKGQSHLAFGIGGQLRTVVDWFKLFEQDESPVAIWEQVVDPDRPDVPL